MSFVDKGKQIDVHDWNDRASALAALQLAAQKWGHFTVEGREDYQALCAHLAAEHGFKITHPELQERIQQERQQRQQARAAMSRDVKDSGDPPPVITRQEQDLDMPARALSQRHQKDSLHDSPRLRKRPRTLR